jgi:predicted  nucleic acid-binding Zn-ribbon protein
MTIDTLSYVKKLESAGVERRQAEAHAEAIRDEVAPQLATKLDLDTAVIRLEHKIDGLEQKLEHKIDVLAQRFEGALWKHSVAIILAVIAIGGLLIRFVR